MKRLRPSLAAASLLLAVLGSATVLADSLPVAVPTVDGAGIAYVGSSACVACHAEQHEAWSVSHHRHAMEPAGEASVRGDFDDATYVRGDETITFHREGERWLVRRRGADGEAVELEVLHTFGWEPLQQYLVAGERGRLQALELAWDVEAGAWIDLYPEALSADDALHWSGPQQTWNYMCADCHSTGLRRSYDAETDGFATTWAEETIGCEACHGAGADHVAWAEGGGAGEGPALGLALPQEDGAWVFAPGAAIAHWEGAPRGTATLELCGPCHANRRLLGEPLAPGGPLLDATMPALLDEGLYRPDGRQEAEVYVLGSFLQSRMAAAGVACGDCHEAHSGALLAEGNGLCARCHEPAAFDVASHHHHDEGSEAAACVSCHMPADTYMLVDARRDHGFRVPDAAVSTVPGVVDACASCHEPQEAWAAAAEAGWWPGRAEAADAVQALALGRGQAAGAAAALAKIAADPARPAILRATALSLLGLNLQPSAVMTFLGALHDPDPLVRLGAVRGLSSLELAERYAVLGPLIADSSKAVRMEVAGALSQVPLADLPPEEAAALGALFEEMLALERLFLDRTESHVNIAGHLANQGDLAGARAAFDAALARDGRFVPAWIGLAEVERRGEGGDAAAEATLRRAIEAAPREPDLFYALGLALHRRGDAAGALAALDEAWLLGRPNPTFAYGYALALDGTGERTQAIAVLEAGLAEAPNDRAILYGLVSLLAGLGETERALAHARRLAELEPENPAVADVLHQLGG